MLPRKLFLLPFLLLVPVVSAGPARILEDALNAWVEEIDQWSFIQQVSEFRGDELREARRERFNPAQPDSQRWELLEINGRKPTEEEVRKFDARKNRKPRKPVTPPTTYVDFQRVTVADETDDWIEFAVPLRSDVSRLIPFEDVAARVVVDKRTSSLARIEIGLREEMRIAFGIARVTELDMSFDLRDAAAPSDVADPACSEQAPEGRASATISNFGNRTELLWTDFARVGK